MIAFRNIKKLKSKNQKNKEETLRKEYDRELVKDLLSRFSSEEVLDLMYQVGFKEPKKTDIKNGWITIRCSGHNDYEEPKTGKRASCLVNVDKTNFKCKSCGRSGNLIDVAQSLQNCNFPEAVEYLAELKNYDLGNKEQKALKSLPLVQKPKEVEKIKYFVFDPLHPVTEWTNRELIDEYFSFNELMKYKAIMTVLIRHSLDVDQTKKIEFLCDKRKIDKTNPRLERVGFLPKKQDDKEFWEWFEKSFPVGDLIRFGIFNAPNKGFSASWKYYSLDLIVFPNQDIYSDLYHGAQLRPLIKPEWLPGKEIQFTNVSLINPIPFCFSREVLMNDNHIVVSEGSIDGLSSGVDFSANPGVNTYFKPYLGLFRGKKVFVAYDQDNAGQRAMFGFETVSHYSARRKRTFTHLFAQTETQQAKAEKYKQRLLKWAKRETPLALHKGLLEDLKDAGVKDVFSLTWDASIGNDLNELKQSYGEMKKEFFTTKRFH